MHVARVLPLPLVGMSLIAATPTGLAAPASIGSFDVVATSGQAAPGVDASFREFRAPALSNAGQMAFHAPLEDADGQFVGNGIFLSDGSGITTILHAGQTTPNGEVWDLGMPVISDSGDIAVYADLRDASTDTILQSIQRYSAGSVGALVVQGQTVPGGDGVFSDLPSAVSINATGQVGFSASLDQTLSSRDQALYLGVPGTITEMAREGDPAPGGGNLGGLGLPALNDHGRITFHTNLSNSLDALVRTDGTTSTLIARQGQPAPDGNGQLLFDTYFSPVQNNAGQVAFSTDLSGTAGGTGDDRGIFRGDGESLVQLAREGQAAPDGNGAFRSFTTSAINDAGEVVFTALLTDPAGGDSINYGLFLSSGDDLVQIARDGQLVPNGNGRFGSIDSVAVNDAGQIAFRASVTQTQDGTSGQALFFFDETSGLIEVVRPGDRLAGAGVVGVALAGGDDPRGDGLSGFNDLGQIAFTFSAENDAGALEGIAVWSIPEPTAAGSLLGLGALTLLRRVRR